MAALLAGGMGSSIISLGQEISSMIDASASGNQSAETMKRRVKRITDFIKVKYADGRFITPSVEVSLVSLLQEFKAVQGTLKWWEDLGSVMRFFNCKDFAVALDKSNDTITQLELELVLLPQEAIARRRDDMYRRLGAMLEDTFGGFEEAHEHEAQEDLETWKPRQAQCDMSSTLAGGMISAIIAQGQEISSTIDTSASDNQTAKHLKDRVKRVTDFIKAKYADGRFITPRVEVSLASLQQEFMAIQGTLKRWEDLGPVQRFFNCKDFALALDKSNKAIHQLEIEFFLLLQDAIAQRFVDRDQRLEAMLVGISDGLNDALNQQAAETLRVMRA
jgi:hypothetical protein